MKKLLMLLIGLMSMSSYAQSVTGVAVINKDNVIKTFTLAELLESPKMMIPSGPKLGLELPPIVCKKDPQDRTQACENALKTQPPYGLMLSAQQMRDGTIYIKMTEMYCRSLQSTKNTLTLQQQQQFNMLPFMVSPLDCSQADGSAKVVPGGAKVLVLNEQGKNPFVMEFYLMAVSVETKRQNNSLPNVLK